MPSRPAPSCGPKAGFRVQGLRFGGLVCKHFGFHLRDVGPDHHTHTAALSRSISPSLPCTPHHLFFLGSRVVDSLGSWVQVAGLGVEILSVLPCCLGILPGAAVFCGSGHEPRLRTQPGFLNQAPIEYVVLGFLIFFTCKYTIVI